MGVIGDITYSDKDVWLWVKLPPSQFEFQDYDTQVSAAQQLNYTLSNLLISDEKSVECHLIISSRPFDSQDWIQSVYNRASVDSPPAYLRNFLAGMHKYVKQYEFREKMVLLGIKIGMRYEYSSTRSLIPLGPLANYINSLTGTVDPYMSDKEAAYWDEQARLYRSSLYSSNSRAQEVYAEELAYIVRKQFFPAMPSPDLNELSVGNKDVWGEGEIAALLDAEIQNTPRYLKMCQMIDGEEHIGYRATLAFAKFPEVMGYPERFPWIHLSSLLKFPTDFSSRFTLEPARKVRKEVTRKNLEAEDVARNQTGAGGNLSMGAAEQLQLGEELDYFLSKSSEPWVFARHRISIEAPTEELLRERVRAVIDRYKRSDILVVWPTGDQLNLLLESLPNDKVRVPAYYQRHQLGIIGGGVPTGSGTVGDFVTRNAEGRELGWFGPYLGHTTGSTVEPVFYSVHSAIARNNPPGCVITGSPGGGKSFAAFTMTYQMALQNIWTIYIDPKGDAKPMVTLPGLENSRLLELREGNAGILDPFAIGDSPATQKDLAIETISLMLGGRQEIDNSQFAQLSRIVQSVSAQPEPSLNKIVDRLLESTNDAAEALGQTLNLIRELPYAKLAFAPKGKYTIRPDQGLTIITLTGLDLPPAELQRSAYSNGNRLAVAVMYLLTSFTRQLMMNLDKTHKKAIVIDEAWAVTSTAQGQKIVQEVARMGRSLNTGLILVSQNAGDFGGEGVRNSVATKLAFRARTTEEIQNILAFFELQDNDDNRRIIRELNNGECLMQDAEGRIAKVQVDAWNEAMKIAFDSNPETRGKKEAEAKA